MNKIVRRLLLVDGLLLTSFGLLGPIYAIYVERIGGDILETGLAFAVYSFTLGVFSILFGKLGDRLKNDRMLLMAGLAVTTVGFAGYLFVSNPRELMAVQFLLGLGQAMYNPMWDTLFASHVDKGKSDSEWADWEAMSFLVAGSTAILGATLVKAFGFGALFGLMAGISLVSLLMVRVLLPRQNG